MSRCEKHTPGPIEATVDPQKMRQVFWNLGINAIEAMPGGGTLTVSVEDSESTVKIVFKDSGSGIEEKDIEKIFYPFFTTKERGTGTRTRNSVSDCRGT